MTKTLTQWFANVALNTTVMLYSSTTEYSTSAIYSGLSSSISPVSEKKVTVWS